MCIILSLKHSFADFMDYYFYSPNYNGLMWVIYKLSMPYLCKKISCAYLQQSAITL
jgi:hypothetical protein